MSSPQPSISKKYAFNIDIPSLIKAIEKRPALYDLTFPSYRERRVKKEMWDAVCNEVCAPGEWDSMSKAARGELSIEVQKKWNNLRSCYRRELTTMHKKHTGKLQNSKMKRTYRGVPGKTR